MAMTSTPALAVAFPRFAVFRFVKDGCFAGLVTSSDESNGCVTTRSQDEHKVNSMSVKFELEVATKAGNEGMVHIRSCQNNKYWARSNKSDYITVSATKPEEERSKEWCTLFEVEQAEEGKVRLKHVRTGNYACAWFSGGVMDGCLLCKYNAHDPRSCDIFALDDWQSYLILPRYVAFKGDNGQYLQVLPDDHPYLQVQGGTNIHAAQIPQEVFYTYDGSLRFRPTLTKLFWRRITLGDWILADSSDDNGDDGETLFAGYTVDDKTVAIQCLANSRFLIRLTKSGLTNCLNASSLGVVDSSMLKVEEAVMKRQIYGFKYHLDNARIYNESIIYLAQTTAVNDTSLEQTIQVNISYENFRSTNWSVNCSLKLSVKDEISVDVPVIENNKIEVGGQAQIGPEWGTTTIYKTTVKSTYAVLVPGRSTVEVTLLATKGFCDVPFSFTQKDVLYNGSTVITEVGGTFVGSNYYGYNIHLSTPPEPTPSKN